MYAYKIYMLHQSATLSLAITVGPNYCHSHEIYENILEILCLAYKNCIVDYGFV